ncbi:MAG: type I restriction endonuclease subunit R [Kiritimatiellia bacterium]
MASFTEEKEREYQNAIVEMMRDVDGLAYAYLGNFQYDKGAKSRSGGIKNANIIEDEMRNHLADSGYTQMQIEAALHKLRGQAALPSEKFADLLECNAAFYNLLVSGTKAKPSPDKPEEDVMFFDFAHPEKNRFALAEEVSYIDPMTGRHARPDIVVYVNGIAICVIELKRSLVTIDEGVRQCLSNERDLIPSFFTTVQFTIAANPKKNSEKSENTGFKYATVGTPRKFWCNWKDDGQKVGTQLTDAASFMRFFDKESFLFLVRYGVVSDAGVKKVMRPHQFHALRACRDRLADKASGVIWHSQGSGKSLTMVWLANYIRSNFPDPRVLVITDRTELDEQIKRNFQHTNNSLYQAKSKSDLLRVLNGGTEWLICSLIHKFGVHPETESRDRSSVKIPLDKYLEELKEIIRKEYPHGFAVKGQNIFVFVDECHRTQGGSLHAAMRKIMGQEVMLIGFTGTPLLKDEKKRGYEAFKNASEKRFGKFIHTYLHKEAVDDGVILDLQYEARDAEQRLDSKDQLDAKFAALSSGLAPERVQELKDRWGTLEKVYSANERIERIGYSILDDMTANALLREDWCNAMLVADSIYSAYKYYDFFQNRCSNTALKNRCAVVTSFSPSDDDLRKHASDPHEEDELKFKHDMAIKSFADLGVNDVDKYEEKAKKRFLESPAQMKLLIVVDKLLTGFDAPTATVLYIDRDMRDHTLFQAICRVNRLGTDVKDKDGKVVPTHKEFGLIVDFKHLFDKIEDAVTRFNSGAFSGFDEVDIDGLLNDSIARNRIKLEAARSAWSALRSDWIARGLTDNDLLVEYYKTDFPPDDIAKVRRQMMYRITQNFVVAYANLADNMGKAGYSSEDAAQMHKEACEARHVNLYVKQNTDDFFDPRQYDPGMRALLDRFVRAEEVETIIPATADFSFLDLIGEGVETDDAAEKTTREAGSAKSAAEVIEAKARSVINSFKDSDPAAYRTYGEQLQDLLAAIRTGTLTFQEQMKQLLEFIKKMKTGEGSYPEGIKTKRQKALWNNRYDWMTDGESEDAAVSAACVAEEAAEYDAGVNWRDANSTDAFLFQGLLKDRFPGRTEEQIYNLYKYLAQNS